MAGAEIQCGHIANIVENVFSPSRSFRCDLKQLVLFLPQINHYVACSSRYSVLMKASVYYSIFNVLWVVLQS